MYSSMSENGFAKHLRVVALLCALCALCVPIRAQDFETVHPGVEYARVDHKIGDDPVKINLLRLDLTKVRLDVHHAFDRAIGVEPTSAIAIRHRAIAAINAGFFRLDKSEFAGDASDVLQIDGALLSEGTRERISLFIKNGRRETVVAIGHVKLWPAVQIGKKYFSLSGVNRERKADEVIAYTPDFGHTTLTPATGAEVVVCNGHVTQVKRDAGSSPIPACGFVLSIDGKSLEDILSASRVRSAVRLHSDSAFLDPKLFDYLKEDIVAGVPQLIKNGRIDITWEQEKASKSFAEMRHPRTAVAKLKGGKFLMITVDGRQAGVSVGMTLKELADYLFSLGATDAMNLDGGGSTTMFLDGRVVNTPSDKEGERRVSDAIVVTLRKLKTKN